MSESRREPHEPAFQQMTCSKHGIYVGEGCPGCRAESPPPESRRELTETALEAERVEKRANAALANGLTIRARNLFRIADALRARPKRRHDA
jgi:hypothetical protein